MDVQYFTYLNSEIWLEKAKKIKIRDKVCLACGSSVSLNCHHGTYVRLGHEKDDDLFTLCQGCHKRLHGEFKNKKKKSRISLLTFTVKFIEKMKKRHVQKKVYSSSGEKRREERQTRKKEIIEKHEDVALEKCQESSFWPLLRSLSGLKVKEEKTGPRVIENKIPQYRKMTKREIKMARQAEIKKKEDRGQEIMSRAKKSSLVKEWVNPRKYAKNK